MSKPSNDPIVVPSTVTDAEPVVETSEEKRPNAFVRSIHKIKQNPKPALAVLGGTALVAVAAVIGRATAPSPSFVVDIELPVEDYPELDVMEVTEDPDTAA